LQECRAAPARGLKRQRSNKEALLSKSKKRRRKRRRVMRSFMIA